LPGNRLYAGFYANEILLRALPEADPQPLLYDAYRHLLQDLLDPAIAIEPPLRRFELTLLDELGYGIDFYHDAHSGESIRDGVNYTFVTEAGFIACSGSQIREQGNIYDGARLLQLGQGDLQSDASRVAAKHIMRQAMRPLLGDKPLQSRRLYRPADADKDSD
jgi:DNA repair protein RecO (recombination protein O)